MKISLSWLKYYVEIPVSVAELCDRMVMAGFEVESVEDLSETMDRVVVGRILKLEKHPDADKLQICQIDVGEAQPVQIVTGAQNVFEGALVPAALHGSKLPNGVQIKKGKLRGVESNGMLCSGEELCLKEEDYPGAGVHGILILQTDAAPGTDMREILHLNDVIIDFKITANRPDCQSVLGVAREVSVVLGTAFHPPVPQYKESGGDIHDLMTVRVDDADLCPRYIGRAVNNLRIAPSPDWMKRCLKAAGMRPINNIVDITNFVMLETGQPMHAFDRRDIGGNAIIVRRANEGETITTLDGEEHALTDRMLVIADAKAPSCLAGIMGSLNSEIKDDTTELFLESAKFRRDNVRRTARSLGMHTESSARFEKGVDIHNTAYAMDRALQLIQDLDAGDIVGGIYDCHGELPGEREITVPASRINDLLGLEIPAETMRDILNSLCIATTLDNGVLTCKVPSFRDDVEGRADLAEEIMRIYGYDHIVGTPITGAVVRGRRLPERVKTDRVKSLLCGAGLREITTYSFIGSKAMEPLRLKDDDPRRKAITILNPLGDEYSTMRTQLVTGMLTVMATNINRKNAAGRLFEVGRLYIADTLPPVKQPEERDALCIGLFGEGEDFFTLKGLVEAVMQELGAAATFERSDEPYLHPGRQARVLVDGRQVAVLGEVHPQTAAAMDIGGRVYVAEIQLAPLYAVEKPLTVYRPLPKFPAVSRDLSLVCDRELPVATLEQAIRTAGGKLLEQVTLFDVYEGERILAGTKSVAYSLTLRSVEHTLTDEEINHTVDKIIRALEGVGAVLRS